jgi:hypothetical protein
MQKSVLTVGILAMALVGTIWGSTVIAADEMCVPMEDITIAPLTADAKRSEVTFPHAVHFSYACQQCHHTWNLTEPVVGCTTSGCHDLDAMPLDDKGRPTKDSAMAARYYKNAYHAMCIGCHKDIKAQNKATEASMKALGKPLPAAGPTGCNQCHPQY